MIFTRMSGLLICGTLTHGHLEPLRNFYSDFKRIKDSSFTDFTRCPIPIMSCPFLRISLTNSVGCKPLSYASLNCFAAPFNAPPKRSPYTGKNLTLASRRKETARTRRFSPNSQWSTIRIPTTRLNLCRPERKRSCCALPIRPARDRPSPLNSFRKIYKRILVTLFGTTVTI